MSGGQIDMLGAPDVGGTRAELDTYDTPAWATRALVHYMGRRLSGVVWEPCAGARAIADELLAIAPCVSTMLMSDIAPRARKVAEFDFLKGEGHPFRYLDAEVRPSWIVTNPPYRTVTGNNATDFVRRSLEVAVVGAAHLLRVAWLEPCADRWELFRDDPPTDYIVLPRVNYIGAPSSNNQTSVWFIWDRRRRNSDGAASVKHYPADIREPGFDWGRL